ncbi:MAG: winged helix DNA-binding protein [Parvibaculum sp.]|nr:winged helix DNA-binding protein [Parvibaculum sp.]
MTEIAERNDTPEERKKAYLTAVTFVERLHRSFLDLIKDELERSNITAINNVQALMLFNIGDTEISPGDLRTRGHYLGSNASYNLKKLVDAGYIHHRRSCSDQRSARIRLTEKGQDICVAIDRVYERHCHVIGNAGDVSSDELHRFTTTMLKLERFWNDQIRYRL